MKKGKTKTELNRRATGFRLDASLVHELKLEALKRGFKNPNDLLESMIREFLQKSKKK